MKLDEALQSWMEACGWEIVKEYKVGWRRKAVTYAALLGNGLPIQRNYGIALGNEKHQPVSSAPAIHTHVRVLPPSITNWCWCWSLCRVIHISFQIWFWCCILVEPLWLRGRSGVRILSRGWPLSNYSLNVIQTCVNLNNGTLPPKQDVHIGLNIHKKQLNAVLTKSLWNSVFNMLNHFVFRGFRFWYVNQ